jgi:DNA invertase Pin-like site-specific DNA recombinase
VTQQRSGALPVRACAAAEFERALIRERTRAGQIRYRQDFDAGKVGKTIAGLIATTSAAEGF